MPHRPRKASERTVVVLGASPKPTRYSYLAATRLYAAGFNVIPVHPKAARVDRLATVPSLAFVRTPVDTLTLYVGPARSRGLIQSICDLGPGRVILNPGTESRELEQALDLAGIPYDRACTLVLLRAGRF